MAFTIAHPGKKAKSQHHEGGDLHDGFARVKCKGFDHDLLAFSSLPLPWLPFLPLRHDW
jgi:hypothetical protein